MEVATVEDERARFLKLKSLVGSLPDANILVLRYLVDFLRKVERHRDKNRMDAKNLATVFAPIIAHRKVCLIAANSIPNQPCSYTG